MYKTFKPPGSFLDVLLHVQRHRVLQGRIRCLEQWNSSNVCFLRKFNVMQIYFESLCLGKCTHAYKGQSFSIFNRKLNNCSFNSVSMFLFHFFSFPGFHTHKLNAKWFNNLSSHMEENIRELKRKKTKQALPLLRAMKGFLFISLYYWDWFDYI